jgi:hypothetical protein
MSRSILLHCYIEDGGRLPNYNAESREQRAESREGHVAEAIKPGSRRDRQWVSEFEHTADCGRQPCQVSFSWAELT